jgi:hypothetical protein
VNVISHNQTISFSQMIRRLERALEKSAEEPPQSAEGASAPTSQEDTRRATE